MAIVVEINNINGSEPLICLLKPKENFSELGISCLKEGLYYGPGVALFLLGSLANYTFMIINYPIF